MFDLNESVGRPASQGRLRAWTLALLCGGALAWPAEAPAQDAAGKAAGAIPDFSGYFVRPNPGSTRIFHPVAGKPGPVMEAAGKSDIDIGDENNPILKPQTAAAVKQRGDQGRAGILIMPPWSLCRPSGVPLVLVLGETAQFLQTPNEVTIIFQRDSQVRHIYLGQDHPKNLAPSWYGHSVGHYEGGALVVDTVALKEGTPVDKYGTPHGAKLHVVERYTLAPDRKSIPVVFTVEDPDMFTAPWTAEVAYRRVNTPVQEVVCAENNRNAAGGLYSLPIATKVDF